MLTTVARLPRLLRPVSVRTLGLQTPGRSGAVLIRSRDQQRRGFRFGSWSIYLGCIDPEIHREVRRHYRMFKRKPLNGYNRRLWWNKHPDSEETVRILKRMASRYWRPKDSRPDARQDGLGGFDAHENPTGVRPGQNIEDVERSALEEFLFGHGSHSERKPDVNTSGGTDRRKPTAPQGNDHSTSVKPGKAPHQAPTDSDAEPTPDYVIDPITNRKVYKVSEKTSLDEDLDASAKSLKSYRSQFTQFEPPVASSAQTPFYSDGPLPPSELRGYNQVNIDETPTDNTTLPLEEVSPDGDIPPTSEELRRYSQVKLEKEPSNTVAEPRMKIEASHCQQPVLESEDYIKNHTPSGSQLASEEDGSTQYTYKGVCWHRDDGLKVNDDKEFSALLGLQRTTSDRVPTLGFDSNHHKYEDLDKYEPVNDQESAITKDPASEYADLDRYASVMEGEPSAPVEPSPQYHDLDKYQPIMDNEPEGSKEPGPRYHDMGKYEPVIEEKSSVGQGPSTSAYEDLGKYEAIRYNEPDGKPPGYVDKEIYPDLHKYEAFRYNEPDGKPLGYEEKPEYDPADMGRYQAFRWGQPDGEPPTTQEEPAVESRELHGYNIPIYRNGADSKPTSVCGNEQSAKSDDSAAELKSYRAFRHNEPDGRVLPQPDPVAESLRQFDLEGSVNPLNTYTEPTVGEEGEDLDLLKASDIRASYETAEDTPSRGSSGRVLSEASEDLSGSSFSSTADMAPTPGEDTTQQHHSTTTSAPGRTYRPPTLTRLTSSQRQQALLDPYSTTPQGLETSYAEECRSKPTRPTYVRTYGTANSAESQRENATSVETEDPEPGPSSFDDVPAALPSDPHSYPAAADPTVYKILAYDPTMQTINVAETTSTVPDGSSALSPAEVLLRLSNPTKFFPHFAPLQAQGFEICSGSGDVLVFRKAKDPFTEERKTGEVMSPPRAPVNPIDMTGARPMASPASANFASPTGYVNYDAEPLDDTRPPPPPPPTRFRSNIDVKREEDVFSGPRAPRQQWSSTTETEGEARKEARAPHFAKRMVVGATWVAGISYAIGVVGEYFKTGGAQGKGPRRF